MRRADVDRSGFRVGDEPRGWGRFAGERDPLAAAARAYVGGRNPRLPRLDRPTVAALVAAHLVLGDGPRPGVLVVAAEEGSLAADRAYWGTARTRDGRDASPLLFAATLPSAAAGELSMTFGLEGPCVVLAGEGSVDALRSDAALFDALCDGAPRLEVALAGWDVADGSAVATLRIAGRGDAADYVR